MANNIDNIVPIAHSVDFDSEKKITIQEYISLSATAKQYTFGRGKNAFHYLIVHSDHGFINLVRDKKSVRIEGLSSPFHIIGVIVDDQNNHSAEIEVNGDIVLIPFEQLVPDKIHAALYSKGISIRITDGAHAALSIHLQWLLSKFEPDNSGKILGWNGTSPMLSWCGCNKSPPLLQRRLSLTSEADYDKCFNELIADCVPLQFVICSAAASTVLAYLSITKNVPLIPFGVSLVGTSSSGKTTALQLAASLYSAPDDETVFSGFYGTQTALLHILSRHKGVPMLYDESTIKNDLSTSSFIYMFTEGKEKLRMNPNGTLKARQSWLCTALFSSENYLVDMQRMEHLGLAARIITLDDMVYTRSSEHSEAIKQFAGQNYGVIGERLATLLIEANPDEILQGYTNIRASLSEAFESCKCKLTDRVCMNYTVIVLTAVLLTEMGLKVDVEGVSDICVKLHENLSANAEPGKNLVIRIFNYICCEYRNLKGIKWTTDKEGMPLKVEIIETTFEKIVTKCGFSDIASAVKFLLNDGYIVRPETGRRKAKISIDGVSAYGYRFDLNKVEEAFGVINDAVYSNVKKYKSADPFSDDTLDIINDEEAIIHAGNYRVENHKEAVSGRAFVL